MDLESFKNLLETSGIKFAYHMFRTPPPLPWGTLREVNSEVFYADGAPYFTSNVYAVELYTAIKEPETELQLEQVLLENQINFEKREIYIETEKMFLNYYECEV